MVPIPFQSGVVQRSTEWWIKGKKSYIDWNYLLAVGKSKCSRKDGQKDLSNLQEQIPSIQSCFHFSLACGTLPWEVWGPNPACPAQEGRKLVGELASGSGLLQQQYPSPVLLVRLVAQPARDKWPETLYCDYLHPPASTLVPLSYPVLDFML